MSLYKKTIGWKNNRIFELAHQVGWHPKLREVLLWIVKLTGEVIITSGYRPTRIYSNDSGVHGTNPLRAVDLRYYIYANAEALQDQINLVFTYDPSRPLLRVAWLHDTGQGKHFHIQVHNKTTKV